MSVANMLPGAPGQMDWNTKRTPAQLLGLSPAMASRAAGQSLPPTSYGAGDRAAVPWSPDSPLFWLAMFTGLTIAGITGASVKVRAFKRSASVNLGDS
jgi:hypothetical protein